MTEQFAMFVWGILLGYIVNDIITGIIGLLHHKDQTRAVESVMKQIERYEKNAEEKDRKAKS